VVEAMGVGGMVEASVVAKEEEMGVDKVAAMAVA
jgi:hypothetical protein